MFSTTIRINFYDADPAGIMFFANVFRFAHSAYEELLENSPVKKEYFYSSKYVVPIIHTEADYFRPVYPNSTIKIEVTLSRLKENSFELSYSFLNESGEKCVEVKTAHVFVNKKSWKKTTIPEEIRNFLEELTEQTG